jgi:hypothetical protein
LRDPPANLVSIRNEGTDDYAIGHRNFMSETPLQFGNAGVNLGASERRFRQIAICRVPGTIAFEKDNIVIAADELPHQPTIGGSVTITP